VEVVVVPILVAIISGPLVVVLQRLRKENSEQHAQGQILLRVLGRKVDELGTKIDGHIGWHKAKDENGTNG
jgi:hypothetical protein